MKEKLLNVHNTISLKMDIKNDLKYIILYGLITAILIFGLKLLQWNFLIIENSIEIYIGLIAIIFTILGVWIASQLIKTKMKTVFVEKPIMIDRPNEFILNEAGLKKLNLTNREYQVLKLIAQGDSNLEIANKLFLSLSTIKTHVSKLYIKMNVKSRFQAISLAKKMNIVE